MSWLDKRSWDDCSIPIPTTLLSTWFRSDTNTSPLANSCSEQRPKQQGGSIVAPSWQRLSLQVLFLKRKRLSFSLTKKKKSSCSSLWVEAWKQLLTIASVTTSVRISSEWPSQPYCCWPLWTLTEVYVKTYFVEPGHHRNVRATRGKGARTRGWGSAFSS